MIDKVQSDRLSTLRLPLIIGVIFIHAFSLQAPRSGAYPFDANSLTQLLLSEGFARLAVPIFYLLAGFFLYGPGLWTVAVYVDKLKARTRSLLVPMLLWGSITLGVFAAAQAHPATARYFSGGTVIATFAPLDYWNALLGFAGSPLAYQFWFIRDLIVVIVLSPGLLIAARKLPLVTLPLMAAVWLLTPKPYPIPAPEAVLFFSLGLFFRSRGLSLFCLDAYARFLWAPYLALVAATPVYLGTPHGLTIQKLGIAAGVPLALWITGLGSPQGGIRLVAIRFASASFFVFAAHEPLLTIIKKLAPKLLPTPLAAYLIAPLIVVLVLLALHTVLAKSLPRLTGLLSGGR